MLYVPMEEGLCNIFPMCRLYGKVLRIGQKRKRVLVPARFESVIHKTRLNKHAVGLAHFHWVINMERKEKKIFQAGTSVSS